MMESSDAKWDGSGNPPSPMADAFAEAQKAEILRQQITDYATGAVKYGRIDRGWANTWLVRLGAQPVTILARYQINVPVTGNYGTTVTAANRTDALAKFSQYVTAVTAAGQVNGSTGGHCDGVYGVQFPGGEPVFFSGPEDVEPSGEPVPGLDALKDGIRQMLKQGITEQGWGSGHASNQIAAMGLEPLPAPHHKTVTVPISGTTQITVLVFDGDDDMAAQRAAHAAVERAKSVSIKPDEIGMVRPDAGAMGLTLVDDEDDGYDPF